MRYRDRTEAGERLAVALIDADVFAAGEDLVVLGIPRGGVPVAVPVSRALAAELDVLVAHKLGAPGNPEFAVGAVAEEGAFFVDRKLVDRLGVSDAFIADERARQQAEVERRADRYRRGREPAVIQGRTCVVVDDGVATGATLEVTLRLVATRGAKRVVVAVPVGPGDTVRRLARTADTVVCPLQPAGFMAVGSWYDSFGQVDDDEVMAALGAGA